VTGVEINVNGRKYGLEVEPRTLLSDALRDGCGLTGTNVGCEHGVCGACTVLINGRSARSCLVFAAQADGASITTIEGLTPQHGLSALQAAFRESFALQCGFCTPGMIVASHELLTENPAPTDAEIREALSGNLCMCTGYVNIIRAVQRAAEHAS
jgi:carbon-monoxide dehydrogenase small subunit